jgi:hypothetical protein
MKYLWPVVMLVLAYWFWRACQRPKERFCGCGG